MIHSKDIVRLYRVMEENDSQILTSKKTEKVCIHPMNEEMVSHELSSKTKRGILFSFTTKLDTAREYARRYEKSKICFVDISLSEPARSVVEIIPAFSRDFWLNRIALDDILLEEKTLVNPATGRSHTIVGLTNYSQRTACGWASSLNEVMLQVDGLKLKDLSDMSGNISPEDTEQLLRQYYIKEVPAPKVMELRLVIKEVFDNVGLKRKGLLDLVNGNSWYKSGLIINNL